MDITPEDVTNDLLTEKEPETKKKLATDDQLVYIKEMEYIPALQEVVDSTKRSYDWWVFWS